jgi:hypothetical protein
MLPVQATVNRRLQTDNRPRRLLWTHTTAHHRIRTFILRKTDTYKNTKGGMSQMEKVSMHEDGKSQSGEPFIPYSTQHREQHSPISQDSQFPPSFRNGLWFEISLSSGSVRMWCSFVIIHVIMIFKRGNLLGNSYYVASPALPCCIYSP